MTAFLPSKLFKAWPRDFAEWAKIQKREHLQSDDEADPIYIDDEDDEVGVCVDAFDSAHFDAGAGAAFNADIAPRTGDKLNIRCTDYW